MSVALDIDPRILSFIHNNDPLPSKLKPVLDAHLEQVRKRVSACDALLGQIEERIADRQRKIQELEKEIKDVQVELRRQMEAKDGHTTALRLLSSTVSVVRRLPPEIVASIISFSVVEGWTGFSKRYLCNACAVSKLWRSTALSTPSLWRFLHVSLYRFSNGRSLDEARFLFSSSLNLWFSRGGEGAEVSLWLQYAGTQREGLAVRDVIAWVLTSRFKFVSLKLEFNPISFPEFQLFLSTDTPSLHQMQELSFHLPQVALPTSQVVSLPTIDIGSTLPKLDSLRFSGDEEPRLLPAFFSHPSVTKLEMANVTFRTRELSELLRALPALQYLELFYCLPQPAEEATGTQVICSLTHRSLREITLHAGISDFFDGLTCPALENFTLDSDSTFDGLMPYPEDLEDSCAQAIGGFFHRSRPSNFALHLGTQFPSTFLNGVFQTSRSAIESLFLRSTRSVSLDRDEDGVGLIIPPSIKSIRSPARIPEEEVAAWTQKLVLCLRDPSRPTPDVVFGVCDVD
ncbi:hypothetical protein BKA70DRAFT_1479611 [Coprinopsis sp. MPI-PUGE-AT-0042]|nr:hypothetical protein BKA70DRAFT_1479611 [Coprinopsis sp. MPI-PUGE-AT-0042]